jgi:hypothetical protein
MMSGRSVPVDVAGWVCTADPLLQWGLGSAKMASALLDQLPDEGTTIVTYKVVDRCLRRLETRSPGSSGFAEEGGGPPLAYAGGSAEMRTCSGPSTRLDAPVPWPR